MPPTAPSARIPPTRCSTLSSPEHRQPARSATLPRRPAGPSSNGRTPAAAVSDSLSALRQRERHGATRLVEASGGLRLSPASCLGPLGRPPDDVVDGGSVAGDWGPYDESYRVPLVAIRFRDASGGRWVRYAKEAEGAGAHGIDAQQRASPPGPTARVRPQCSARKSRHRASVERGATTESGGLWGVVRRDVQGVLTVGAGFVVPLGRWRGTGTRYGSLVSRSRRTWSCLGRWGVTVQVG